MLVCGFNEFWQLGEESNNQNPFEAPVISPPKKSHFNLSELLSISLYSDHLVYITKKNKAFGIGNNKDGKISPKLPLRTLEEETEVKIKDKNGEEFKFISVVCGSSCTLYQVQSKNSTDGFQLVLAIEKGPFIFLSIFGRTPISLFGGDYIMAAIDSEGCPIFITGFDQSKNKGKATPLKLPSGDPVVEVAFCGMSFLCVDTGGRLFESRIDKEKDYADFKEVTELSGSKIVSIKGVGHHCLALCEDWRVFGKGDNFRCCLGFPSKTVRLEKFTVIDSLSEHKIVAALAGGAHSIFITSTGKILGCGGNFNGELLFDTIGTNVFPPAELPSELTSFYKNPFFILGSSFTLLMEEKDAPPNIPNKRIVEAIYNKSRNKASSEIAELKKKIQEKDHEIERIRKEFAEKEKKFKKKIADLEKSGKDKKVKPKDSELDICDCQTIDNLKVVKAIGRGAQSEVFEVTRDQHFALKVLDIQGMKSGSKSGKKSIQNSDLFSPLQHLLQEYEIIHLLNHPNIIKTFGFCFGDEKHAPSILLEFCPSNLNDIVDDMSDTEKVCAIVEVCMAMEAVHASNLIHRDLKPENILIDNNGHVKVSDFGISCINADNKTKSKTAGVGSLKFMAPEILNESTHYDNKVDVYSFGVVVFFILTGKLPKISIIDQGRGKKASIPNKVNKISRKLINLCWSFDANDRPSFHEIMDFIKTNNFKLINDVEQNIDEIKNFLSL